MSHLIHSYQAKLTAEKEPSYIGYHLNRSPDAITPEFQVAREVCRVLRSLYAVGFALVDMGLEELVRPALMPQVMMECRILKLGYTESDLSCIFTHAHYNYVALNTFIDWDARDESLLVHLCMDARTCLVDASTTLEQCGAQEHTEMAQKEFQLFRDMLDDLLSDATSTASAEPVEPEMPENPPWVDEISVKKYLELSPAARQMLHERLAQKWDTQTKYDECRALKSSCV